MIGSATYGWVELPQLAPIGGAHSERIQAQQVSLWGVTTSNLRAVKRRWQVAMPVVDACQYGLLMGLYETAGPWWLYDPTRPSGIAYDRRGFTGWKSATGLLSAPTVDRRWVLPNTGTAYYPEDFAVPDVNRLLPVTPGQLVTFAVTARSATTASLTMQHFWYTAALTRSADVIPKSVPAGSTENRYTTLQRAPAGAAFMQPGLSTTGTTMTVTDPATGPRDPGPAWYSVIFDDLTEQHHNPYQRSLTLTLREV